jgi:uncharacterized membrane protein YeaQ/YmgE (transglycosylase-associated protein family)
MDVISDLLAAPFVCIGWLIVGAIAGALANSAMRSDAPLLGDIILGLLGALVGGFLVGLLGLYRPTGGAEGVIASLVVATLGAIVLIAIGRLFTGRRAV